MTPNPQGLAQREEDMEDEDDEEKAIIVCVPVDGTPLSAITDDSTIWRCMRCRQDIWLSAAGVRFVGKHPQATIVCTPCIVDDPNLTAEAISAYPNEDKGLTEWLDRSNHRQRIVDLLKRQGRRRK